MRAADTGQTEHLQSLLNREIVVPAKTVGLSDCEESIRGKVVDIHQEEDSLWCTVAGDKRWYGASLASLHCKQLPLASLKPSC